MHKPRGRTVCITKMPWLEHMSPNQTLVIKITLPPERIVLLGALYVPWINPSIFIVSFARQSHLSIDYSALDAYRKARNIIELDKIKY